MLNSLFNLLHFNRKNWRPISLCVLAATIFWFFNALNKNYTTTISFPLRFDYDDRNYIPVKPLQDELRLNVTGMGWDIFRKTIGLREQPLVIPLDRPSTIKKIVGSGSTLPALLASQLETLQINFVVNDTLYIDFEPKGRRWLSLSSDSVPGYIHRDFGIVGPINISPDSLLLEGPLKMITALPEPYSLTIAVSEIDEDFDEEIRVNVPGRNFITMFPSRVRLSFSVERFVEMTDTVRLELTNIPRNAQPKMEVAKLPATIRIQQSMVQSFPWDSLRAVVDLKAFSKGNIKVRPTLVGLPLHAELVKIDTIRITY